MVSDAQACRQFGNAVSPYAIDAIGAGLVRVLVDRGRGFRSDSTIACQLYGVISHYSFRREKSLSDPHFIAIEQIVRDAIKAGNDVRKIRQDFGPLFGIEVLDKAITNAKAKMDTISVLIDPHVIKRQLLIGEKFKWYGGPHEKSERWEFAKQQLLNEGRSQEEIEEVVKSSSEVLSLLSSPSADTFASRGLVLGYVQSGKTTNFIATISQAADEGYRLIIVLSGVTNNLRKQTQERLERSLTGENPKNWNWLTSIESDFNESKNSNNLLSAPDNRVIAVVKKNNSRLKRLTKWIESAPIAVRQGLPVLIIDDEADQATVNSAKLFNRQTAINKTLTSMLKPAFLPKNAYLGYTATPFANILSDAKDETQLFPRDFIYPLKRSDKYFGAEQLFGREPIDEDDQAVSRERDIIIPIASTDRDALGTLINPSSHVVPTELPGSLHEAIHWFLIATAARRVRSKKNKFSTMLIHTSGRIPCHKDMKILVAKYLKYLRELPNNSLDEKLSDCWSIRAEDGWLNGDSPTLAWDEIKIEVSTVLDSCKLIVDNSKSDDRLVYAFEDESTAVPYIVIGGNTLARGLTLEGLICSYFMRTSTAYDSLLQMGRWFGYRVGYEDLQRIWMQDDLISNFRHMALVEEEIRQQIEQLAAEGLDPSQVPIRIRDHKLLAITAVNKMKHAKLLQIGYSDTRVETISLDSKAEILLANQLAAKSLIENIKMEGLNVAGKNPEGWPMFNDVPWPIVSKFFDEYKWADAATRADGEYLKTYIDAHQGTGDLENWNIFVYQINSPDAPVIDLGNGITATAIVRSALEKNEEKNTVNIHHLVSSIDGAADVGLSKKTVTAKLKSEGKKVSDTSLRALRKGHPESVNRGLLGIYIVDKDSKANPKTETKRKDLEIPEHAVGLGIFFGESKVIRANSDYYGPDLIDETEIDDDYLDDADDADDAVANQ